jgi:hypothetical protein
VYLLLVPPLWPVVELVISRLSRFPIVCSGNTPPPGLGFPYTVAPRFVRVLASPCAAAAAAAPLVLLLCIVTRARALHCELLIPERPVAVFFKPPPDNVRNVYASTA